MRSESARSGVSSLHQDPPDVPEVGDIPRSRSRPARALVAALAAWLLMAPGTASGIGGGTLSLQTVSCPEAVVELARDGLEITVEIRNVGSGTMTLTTVSLDFTHATSGDVTDGFSVTRPDVSGSQVAIGATTYATFVVEVGDLVPPGAVTVDAFASAGNGAGGTTSDGDASNKLDWTVVDSRWTELLAEGAEGAPPVWIDHAMAFDPGRGRIVLFGGAASSTPTNATWEWDGSSWHDVSPVTAPPARGGPGFAHDSGRDRTVMFGGLTSQDVDLGDTWEWDGTVWVETSPATSPSARSPAGMAYDAARDRIVLFGGEGLSGGLDGDTWEYDGSAWEEVTPATAPAARSAASLAYDPVRRKVVLFGGIGASGRTSDTWEYDGSTWTEVTPATAPAARFNHRAVFDPGRAKIVLHGGQTGSSASFRVADTWEWDGSVWTQLTSATSPRGRSRFGMAHDAWRGRTLVFGGLSAADAVIGDTWGFGLTAGTLSLVATRASTATLSQGQRGVGVEAIVGNRGAAAISLDSASLTFRTTAGEDRSGDYRVSGPVDLPVTLAGHTSAIVSFAVDALSPGLPGAIEIDGSAVSSDALDGQGDVDGSADETGGWTMGELEEFSWLARDVAASPGARSGTRLTHDSRHEETVLFGGSRDGSVLGDTWIWSGSKWSDVTTLPASGSVLPSRAFHGLSHDSARGRVVLFGGRGAGGALGDTWEWNGDPSDSEPQKREGWSERHPATGPSGRSGHGQAFDAARGETVVFGGALENGAALGDTWTWDGEEWELATPSTVPSPRIGPAMAYDAGRERVVLFGGSFLSFEDLDDTWEWDGTSWTEVTPASSPPARSGAVLVHDPIRGKLLLSGGAAGDGVLGDIWEWDGSSWSEISPTNGPPAREGAGAAFDATRGHLVLHGGSVGDPGTDAGDTWTFSFTAARLAFSPLSIPDFIERGGAMALVQAPVRNTGGSAATLSDASLRFLLASSETDVSGDYAVETIGSSSTVPAGGSALKSFIVTAGDAATLGEVEVHVSGSGADLLSGAAMEATSPAAPATWTVKLREVDWTELVANGTAGSPEGRGGSAVAFDARRGRFVLFGGLVEGAEEFADDTWEWDGSAWSLRATDGSTPTARLAHAMVHDTHRGVTVLFGGTDGDAMNDTWEWDGTSWSEATPATAPPVRDRHSMAFDSRRGRTVLFGGRDASYLGDTWEWDGTVWEVRSPATSPAPRSEHELAFDEARGRVVLFGGRSDAGLWNDTWEWDGERWVELSTELSPTERRRAHLAYDAARQRTILFGGVDSFGELGDTWEWDGATWAMKAPRSSPLSRSNGAMAYDRWRGRSLLFGGSTGTNELWGYGPVPATLAVVATETSTPSAGRPEAGLAATARIANAGANASTLTSVSLRFLSASGEDVTSHFAVVPRATNPTTISSNSSLLLTFSVDVGSRAPLGPVAVNAAVIGADTESGEASFAATAQVPRVWELVERAAGTWTDRSPAASPGQRDRTAAAFDSLRGRTVLFGGSVDEDSPLLDDTWEWDGTIWTDVSPATSPGGRTDHQMVFDAARGVVLLFGGFDDSGRNASTWTWDGSVWTDVSPALSPPERVYHSMAYDAARQRVVLFGGNNSTAAALADTWEWDGTSWEQKLPETSPPGRTQGAMGYDPILDLTVLFGGRFGGTAKDDTWTWDGTAWRELSNAATPPAREAHEIVYDAGLDRLVMFGGQGGSRLNDLWTFDGTEWAEITPSTGPDRRQGHVMVYDSWRGRTVLFGGNDGQPFFDDTWTLQPSGGLLLQPATGAGQATVFRTEEGVTATVSVANAGASELEISTAALSFFGADGSDASAGFTVAASATNATTLSGGASALLTFTVAVMRDAALGEVTLHGAVRAKDATSGRTFVSEAADEPASWTVERPETLWIERVADGASGAPSRRGAAGSAFDLHRGKLVLFGGTGVTGRLQDTWEWDGTIWSESTGATMPSTRSGATLCYDTARRVTVLFGGIGEAGRLEDTWEWDGAGWQDVSPATSPPGRTHHGLVFDIGRGRAVLFGGAGTSASTSDTWEWDGTVWREVSPATGPAPRSGHAMAYDASRGVTVLFGGVDESETTLLDTWEWDGTVWSQVPTVTTPGRRFLPFSAYDSARRRVLLFGGGDEPVLPEQDTWEFDGTAWTAPGPPASPPRRTVGASAYDAWRGEFLIFGGNGGSGELSDLWAYTQSAATLDAVLTEAPSEPAQDETARVTARVANAGAAPVVLDAPAALRLETPGSSAQYTVSADPANPTSLPGNSSALMTFTVDIDSIAPLDPATFHARASGVDAESGGATSDATAEVAATWQVREIDDVVWSHPDLDPQPSSAFFSGMVFDSRRGLALLFGGFGPSGFSSETWEWDGARWELRAPATSPPGRDHPMLAYDSHRGRTVLFGGSGSEEAFDDTWEWDGTRWEQRFPATSPPAFFEYRGVYDAARRRVVMHSPPVPGIDRTATWTWDGTNWTLQPAAGEPNVSSTALAYDARRERVVLFGGFSGPGRSNGTWEWDGSTWTERSPATAPLARSNHAMAYDSARQVIVMQGGRKGAGASGGLSDTWEWDGTSWIERFPASAPAAGSDAPMTYDSWRGRILRLESITSGGSTWLYSQSAGTLSVVSVESQSPELIAGQTGATFTARVSSAGIRPAILTAASLRLEGAGGSDVTTRLVQSAGPALPATLSGGESYLLTFTAGLSSAAPATPVTVHAAVGGRDPFSAAPTEDSTADLPGSLAVIAPASLALGGLNAPADVSSGQSFTAQLTVTNTGESDAEVSAASLSLGGNGLTAVLQTATPKRIAGGASATLTFAVTASPSAAAGVRSASVTVTAKDAVTGGDAGTSGTLPGALTVHRAAALRIAAVSAGPDQVARGQTGLTVSVSVVNEGGTTAQVDLSSSGLRFGGSTAGYAVTPDSGPATLPPDQSATYVFSVTVLSSAASGAVAIDAFVSATDSRSGLPAGDSGTDSTDSWTVLAPARLTAGPLQAPAAASLGQTFPATVTLSNAGQVSASVSLVTLAFGPAGLAATSRSTAPVELDPGAAARFEFDVAVSPSAATGPATATLSVVAAEAFSSASVGGNLPLSGSVRIQRPAALLIGDLIAPATVVPGQTFEASFSASNAGETTARVDAASLELTGEGLAATPSPTSPSTLAGGASASFEFSVSVASNAPAGLRTVAASLLAADALSGADASATRTFATPIRVASSGPVLTFGPLQARATASLGQSFDAAVDVVNSGTGAAALSTATLSFGEPAIGAVPDAGNPASAGAGNTVTLRFRVSSTLDAPAGLLAPTLSLTASGPGGEDASVSGTLVPSVLFQRPARLEIVGLTGPAAVRAGETFEALVAVGNTGDATATNLAGTLTFDAAGFVVSAEPGGPASLSGGGEVNLRFVVTAPVPAPAGDLTAEAAVSARDANTGESVSRSARLTASFRIDDSTPFTLSLAPGLNLLSLEAQPLTTELRPMSALELSRAAGASLLSRLEAGRFSPYLPGKSAPFELQAGRAYLLHSPPPARTVELRGRPWPAASIQLSPPLALLGYPVDPASPRTLEDLRELTGATFIIWTLPGPAGRQRFQIYLPGVTPAPRIAPGAGYLLGIPAETPIQLPASP